MSHLQRILTDPTVVADARQQARDEFTRLLADRGLRHLVSDTTMYRWWPHTRMAVGEDVR